MNELVHTKIPMVIESPSDLTYEQCKTIMKTNNLYYIIVDPIRNYAELKILLYKEGYKWIKEQTFTTFYIEDVKIFKCSWDFKWIQINPIFKENPYPLKVIASIFPKKFLFYIGNELIERDTIIKSKEII